MSAPDWLDSAYEVIAVMRNDGIYYKKRIDDLARCVEIAKAACEYVEAWNYDGHDDKDTLRAFNALHSAISGEDA